MHTLLPYRYHYHHRYRYTILSSEEYRQILYNLAFDGVRESFCRHQMDNLTVPGDPETIFRGVVVVTAAFTVRTVLVTFRNLTLKTLPVTYLLHTKSKNNEPSITSIHVEVAVEVERVLCIHTVRWK